MEEMHRTGHGDVMPSTLPTSPRIHEPRNSLNLLLLGFLWRLPFVSMMDDIIGHC